ncbi:MAG TPA: hypothetical protein IAB47_10040 [Candidatus Scatomorpha merdigallinarum]|nr:hypothetical protein [Candidatus Scatomorpha merdigallinarum]
MAHEILSIKLCELDDRIVKLRSRIRLSECSGHTQLKQEISKLKKECIETQMALQEELRWSRGVVVSALSKAYEKVEAAISASQDELRSSEEAGEGSDLSADEKTLLAEYALDFAMQAADRAMLLSLEAIDSQMTQIEQEEGSSR